MFIQTEETPNPLTLKFIPGKVLLEKGTQEFKSKKDAKSNSLANILFKIDKPSVGILNVGKEEIKGNEEIKNASDRLKELNKSDIINYHGYIEGNDISLSKLGYIFSSISLRSVQERLDPRVHNCGIFMGLNALVVKCHGQSEFKGVSYAADIIYSLLENDVNQKIKKYVLETQNKIAI